MTKTNGLVLAAFLMASTSPMAFGQTTPPASGADTSAGTDTTTATDLPVGATTTDVDMERTLLITSLTMDAGDKDWEEEFSNLSDDAEVKIVQLSELKDSDHVSADGLDQAISDMEEGRSDLRAAIEDRDRLMSALEDEDYAAEDVVAAVIQPGDAKEVTLIVDTEND